MTKKKITASERYWEKRRELEDKARLKLEKKTLSELESVFERALVKIQRQLLSQADLHDITQSEMLEDFSKRDQEKYRKYIEKNYEKLMESDEAYKQFIDEYFPSYDYAKVNRLLQLRADIFSTLADEAIASDVNGKFNNDLENITKRIYNSNANALMQLLGDSAPGLTKNELEKIMNYPWSGKTFSSRLWGNISTLEQRLSNSIINSLASGEGVLEALKTMKNDGVISGMFKLEQGKFNRSIENLVRTEYSHFAVEGVRKSLKNVGVKQTQSWSAEDERVCSICGGRHGKEIKDDWHPPYHGRCRCTEIPIVPEISDDIDKLYEEMFGDLLDEFASDQWGVKLNHPKKQEETFDHKIKKMMDTIDIHTASFKDIITLGQLVNEEYKIGDILGKKERITEIMNEFRPMYGAIPKKSWYNRTNKQIRSQIENAFYCYPKEWADLLVKNNRKIYGGKANRGFFSGELVNSSGRRLLKGATFGDGVSIYMNGTRKTTPFHEIGHLIEFFKPELLKISKDFIEARTAGESEVHLKDIFPGFGYSYNEVTKKDNFISPYIGKNYNNASEVLSVGLESIFEPEENGHLKQIKPNGVWEYAKITDDPEYLHLIIGMLLKG
ncbi:TPA: hypothetical protein ACGBG5_003230 [Enterococcus faecalis]